MSKNIVMQELTDNGYDALYPKTSADQIEGISEYDWKIGDVRCTARSDLGDKWALCNGDKFKPEDYPEMANILMPTWEELSAYNSEQMLFHSIAYHDGLWVGVGTLRSNNRASIYTTRDLTEKWTKRHESSYYASFDKVIYANGYWAVISEDTNVPVPQLYYSSNGYTWNGINLPTSYKTKLSSIAYHNGQWVAIGSMGGEVSGYVIWTSTDLTQASSWSYQSLREVGSLKSVMCVNGLWIVLGCKDNEKYVYTTNNPTGAWNKNTISNSTFRAYGGDIVYQDGLYKAIFQSVIEPIGTYIYTTTDPTGTWSESYLTDILLNSMDYYNGILRAIGKRNEESAGNGWVCQIRNLKVCEEQKIKKDLYCIACANNQWVIGAATTTFYSTYGFPLITSDLTYNYIKAKP